MGLDSWILRTRPGSPPIDGVSRAHVAAVVLGAVIQPGRLPGNKFGALGLAHNQSVTELAVPRDHC